MGTTSTFEVPDLSGAIAANQSAGLNLNLNLGSAQSNDARLAGSAELEAQRAERAGRIDLNAVRSVEIPSMSELRSNQVNVSDININDISALATLRFGSLPAELTTLLGNISIVDLLTLLQGRLNVTGQAQATAQPTETTQTAETTTQVVQGATGTGA